MHTLFDFISNVNGTQYVLAVLFIAGFILFNEILKPRPFRGLAKMADDEVSAFKAEGKGKFVRFMKGVVAGPVYLVLYVLAVPVLLIHETASLLSKVITATSSVGWSPVYAYFTGRKKAKKGNGHERQKPE